MAFQPRLRDSQRTYAERSKVPKGSGFDTRIQHERHLQRSTSAMQGIRWGWRIMSQTAEKEMKKHNIPQSGSYDPNNCHRGEMPGWPKECNFTDNKAKRILYAVYKSGQVTWPQLRAVRRTLSYTYELVTGGNEKSQSSNWPGVKNTWKTFNKSNLLFFSSYVSSPPYFHQKADPPPVLNTYDIHNIGNQNDTNG